MRLTFDADHLRRLLELSRASDARVPALEQVLDPSLWRADLGADRIALLEGEIAKHGIALSATADDIDPDLIGPGLILVGDQGVYFTANIPIDQVRAAKVPHVAYAAEVNPQTLPFEEWWEAKRDSFGPDDGTAYLSEEFIGPSLARTALGGSFLLEVSPDQIAILEGSPETPEL
jgi:hypothetical protein